MQAWRRGSGPVGAEDPIHRIKVKGALPRAGGGVRQVRRDNVSPVTSCPSRRRTVCAARTAGCDRSFYFPRPPPPSVTTDQLTCGSTCPSAPSSVRASEGKWRPHTVPCHVCWRWWWWWSLGAKLTLDDIKPNSQRVWRCGEGGYGAYRLHLSHM